MRKMPFYTKIKDGIHSFNRPEIFAAYCKLMKDGDYCMELSRSSPSKTNEQLGYFHAVVVPVIFKQIQEFEGEAPDGGKRFPQVSFMIKDQLKQIPMTEENIILMLKIIWAKSKGCEVKSKADMNIEEASELIDVSILWAARYLGCVIPPPNTEEQAQQDVKH